jgi:hypothetical protein
MVFQPLVAVDQLVFHLWARFSDTEFLIRHLGVDNIKAMNKETESCSHFVIRVALSRRKYAGTKCSKFKIQKKCGKIPQPCQNVTL